MIKKTARPTFKRKEKDIEREILVWLNLQPGCHAWKNKSMGTYSARAGAYLANRSRFSEKGSSDILGIYRGYMLCIEVKTPTGRVLPHQAEFLDRMDKLGAIAFIARSLEEVKGKLFHSTIKKLGF